MSSINSFQAGVDRWLSASGKTAVPNSPEGLQQLAQENEWARGRIRDLEAENRRLQAQLDGATIAASPRKRAHAQRMLAHLEGAR